MFRLSPSVFNARCLLHHRKVLNIQPAPVFSTTNSNLQTKNVQESQSFEKPVPPPQPPRDLRPYIGALALAVLTGSFTVYARKNPHLRDWLTINAPWLDEFIAVVFEEDISYEGFARQCVEDGQVAVGLLSRNVTETPKCFAVPVSHDAEELRLNDLEELHCCIREAGEKLVKSYEEATAACKDYNQLVEISKPYFDKKTSQKLEAAKSERIAKVQAALENEHSEIKRFDQLVQCFETGTPGVPPQEKKCINTLICQFERSVETTRTAYKEEENMSECYDQLWTTVFETFSKFTEQAQAMCPGLDFSSDKPQLQGDPDLFLLYASRYVEKLQNELNAMQASMTRRTELSLATLPQDDKSVKVRDCVIKEYFKDDKECCDMNFEERYKILNEKNDEALKIALAEQQKKQEEIFEIELLKTEIETKNKINKMIEEKVAEEKNILEHNLTMMRERVQHIEHKLAEKMEADKKTRRSHDLYEAVAALITATKRGSPVVKVEKELKTIKKIAKNDKLVNAVLKALPKTIWQEGVVPESVLRDRYHTMEKVALKVALVEEEGASLPVYFASWMQSLFLYVKLSGIPTHEVDSKHTEPITDLDTFDLLRRARYWVEHGDYRKALRYVSALQGASLAAARSWHDAVHDHLELRQAAEALQAHAAALALQYV